MKSLLKSIVLYSSVLFLSVGCGNSDSEPENPDPGKEDTLVTLDPSRSFSILSISVDKGVIDGVYVPSAIAGLVKEQDADIVCLQDIDFRSTVTGEKDLLTAIAHFSNTNGIPRQGTFTPIEKLAKGENGLGLMRRDCFQGTERKVLDGKLVMHTMKYSLGSGLEVLVATCQFDRNNPDRMMDQANALIAFAENQTEPFLVAASIHAEKESNVLSRLQTKFRRSCKYSEEKTYPAAKPAKRYDYILTPLSQSWGTQHINIIGDKTVSSHKGIIIRLGLK